MLSAIGRIVDDMKEDILNSVPEALPLCISIYYHFPDIVGFPYLFGLTEIGFVFFQ